MANEELKTPETIEDLEPKMKVAGKVLKTSLPDAIVYTDISGRIGTRCASNGWLIDMDDITDMFDALEWSVFTWQNPVVVEDGVQFFV